MGQRRPWNRLRKISGVVLALAVMMFVVGLVADEVALKIVAAALLVTAALINLFSLPSQGS